MKQCCTCKQLKPESEFYKDKTRADGLQPRCKECDNLRCRKRYKANPENHKKSMKLWYLANRARELERNKQYNKQWRVENPAKYLWKNAKTRAKQRGLEFNLDLSDIVIPEICPVLGLPLKQATGKKQDNSPSLDRIDSSKGYVKGNVRVISDRANTLKNNATVEELKLLLVDAVRLERNAA